MVNPSRSTLPLPSNVLHFPSHPARKCPARIANDQKKYAYIMFLSFMVVKNINMCPGAVFWLWRLQYGAWYNLRSLVVLFFKMYRSIQCILWSQCSVAPPGCNVHLLHSYLEAVFIWWNQLWRMGAPALSLSTLCWCGIHNRLAVSLAPLLQEYKWECIRVWVFSVSELFLLSLNNLFNILAVIFPAQRGYT